MHRFTPILPQKWHTYLHLTTRASQRGPHNAAITAWSFLSITPMNIVVSWFHGFHDFCSACTAGPSGFLCRLLMLPHNPASVKTVFLVALATGPRNAVLIT